MFYKAKVYGDFVTLNDILKVRVSCDTLKAIVTVAVRVHILCTVLY